MTLVDLKQKVEQSKQDFWLFLMEQSLHDPQFDIFTQHGQFCRQIDEALAHTEQAFAELDAAAEEARAKMHDLVSKPDAPLSPRMDEEFEGMTDEQIEDLDRQAKGNTGTDSPASGNDD